MTAIILLLTMLTLLRLCQWLYQRSVLWMRRYRNGRAIVFVNGDIDTRAFYVRRYRRVPTVNFISNLDAGRAFQMLSAWNRSRVEILCQRNFYNWQLNRNEFVRTVFSVGNGIIVELGTDWVEILSRGNDGTDLAELINSLTACRAEEQEQVQVIGFRRNPVLEN